MKRSCPFFAEASEAAFAERSTRLMWSTMTFVSCFCPHCLQKVPSNQVSYAGTKWLHWSIFSVFRWAAAVSGNRKNGPEPTPAARAPLPVHLMKSRRDTPSCFFFAILVPSEEQMGPGKLASRIEGKSLPEPMMLLRGRASQSASPGYFIFPTLSQIIVPTEEARIILQILYSTAPAMGI